MRIRNTGLKGRLWVGIGNDLKIRIRIQYTGPDQNNSKMPDPYHA